MSTLTLPTASCVKCGCSASLEYKTLFPARPEVHGGIRLHDTDGREWIASCDFPTGWTETAVGLVCGPCFEDFKKWVAPPPPVVEPPPSIQKHDTERPPAGVSSIPTATQRTVVNRVISAEQAGARKTVDSTQAAVIRPGSTKTAPLPSAPEKKK